MVSLSFGMHRYAFGLHVPALFLSCAILLKSHICFSQEAPIIGATKWAENINYRTDVCARQAQFANGDIELKDALSGLELSVYITDHRGSSTADLFSLTEEGTLPELEEELGFTAKILDELAKRANFTWRTKFASGPFLTAANDGNRTYTDLLLWGTDRFDIVADINGLSSERKAVGISFVESFYDNSIILATLKTKRKNSQLWNLFKPFDKFVWIMIGVSTFATGFLYTFLERLDNNADERRLDNKPLAATFLAAITFTGHFEFKPNSHAARLLSFSWSFWALITASAYTANLASFLVYRTTVSVSIDSMEDIIRSNKTVCVWDKTLHEEFIANNYPSYYRKEGMVVRKKDLNEVMKGLFAKDDEEPCDLAITGKTFFDESVKNDELNQGCQLTWVGDILEPVPAGLVTAVDTGSNCTSLISYVLDIHMNEMKTTNDTEKSNYKQKLDEFVNRNTKDVKKCSKNGAADGEETQSLSLDISDVGGIFVVHLLACFVSLSLAAGQYYLARRRMANSGSAEEGDEPPSSERIMVDNRRQSIWAPRVVDDSQQSSRNIQDDPTTIWESTRSVAKKQEWKKGEALRASTMLQSFPEEDEILNVDDDSDGDGASKDEENGSLLSFGEFDRPSNDDDV